MHRAQLLDRFGRVTWVAGFACYARILTFSKQPDKAGKPREYLRQPRDGTGQPWIARGHMDTSHDHGNSHARCDGGSCASPTSGDQVDGLPLAPSFLFITDGFS